VAALTTGAVEVPVTPRGIRWTTLDYVLLGWIAAQGAPTLPGSPTELYEQVLGHEENYWSTVYRDTVRERRPNRARLRKAAALPFSSLGLCHLALIVDQQRLNAARAATTAPPTLANLLVRVSHRASDTGDRAGALEAITEAVEHYRRLAQANPAAYLPDLAASLNNLSVQQSGTGDRAGALGSITEAVEHYRRLAQANPTHSPTRPRRMCTSSPSSRSPNCSTAAHCSSPTADSTASKKRSTPAHQC
jgi:tetratricopeptide (TPR) repeat protein